MCGAVSDFAFPVGRVLRLGRQIVAVLFEGCADVAFHGDAEGLVIIVKVKVDAGIIPAFPVGGDVVLFKDRAKVFGVVFLDILDAKII